MKRFVTLLIAAIFLLAVQPGTMAMPVVYSHSMSTHVTHSMSQQNMECDHSMPMQKHGNPCKDMGCCMGMLSCFGIAAAVPGGAAVILQLSLTATQAWPTRDLGLGITLAPDNPPPIA